MYSAGEEAKEAVKKRHRLTASLELQDALDRPGERIIHEQTGRALRFSAASLGAIPPRQRFRQLSIRSVVACVSVLTVTGACAGTHSVQEQVRPRSYLALPIDSLGNLPVVPYVWERAAGGKHLAVIGTLHTRDPRSPMYAEIEAIFERVRPQLVLHESTAPARADTSRDRAIERAGGIGLAVYLAGRYGAVARSGDASEQEEFAMLLARYPARDVVVFLAGQRFLGGYDPDSTALAAEYADFFEGYLAANGIPAREGWERWEGFLRAYQQVLGRPFTSGSWDPDLVSPIRDAGRLSEVSRAAHEFRDLRLLAAIRKGVQEHDRVVVVFGGWHVLALEPILARVLEGR